MLFPASRTQAFAIFQISSSGAPAKGLLSREEGTPGHSQNFPLGGKRAAMRSGHESLQHPPSIEQLDNVVTHHFEMLRDLCRCISAVWPHFLVQPFREFGGEKTLRVFSQNSQDVFIQGRHGALMQLVSPHASEIFLGWIGAIRSPTRRILVPQHLDSPILLMKCSRVVRGQRTPLLDRAGHIRENGIGI